jgi:hypothetical protein
MHQHSWGTPGAPREQLALLVVQPGTQLRYEDVLSYVSSAIEVCVQLERRHAQGSATQMSWSGAGD